MLAVEWSQGIEDAWADLAGFAPKLIAAVVVLMVGWFIARVIRKIVEKVLTKIKFMLTVLQLAIGVFGDSAVHEAFDGLIAFIPKLFIAIIIVVITGVVANTVRSLVEPAVSHLGVGPLLAKAAFVAIWVIGGFAAFDQLEVASDTVDTLFQTVTYSLGLILVIKFGVGGVWAARDRFWPAVYDGIASSRNETSVVDDR